MEYLPINSTFLSAKERNKKCLHLNTNFYFTINIAPTMQIYGHRRFKFLCKTEVTYAETTILKYLT